MGRLPRSPGSSLPPNQGFPLLKINTGLGRVDEFEVFPTKSVGYRKTYFSLNASKNNWLLLIRQHALVPNSYAPLTFCPVCEKEAQASSREALIRFSTHPGQGFISQEAPIHLATAGTRDSWNRCFDTRLGMRPIPSLVLHLLPLELSFSRRHTVDVAISRKLCSPFRAGLPQEMSTSPFL